MGRLAISLEGSFQPNNSNAFSAMSHGHAAAVLEAIKWLQTDCLPRAVEQDQRLQREGHCPSGGFIDLERAARLADNAEIGEEYMRALFAKDPNIVWGNSPVEVFWQMDLPNEAEHG